MLSLYLHWPFCISKCPYCDFNSHINDNVEIEEFIDCYIKEINYFADIIVGKKIHSIYFGGGTPSLAPISFYDKVLAAINKLASFNSKSIEITVEANPASSEYIKFRDFYNSGVNRVSIGIQSLNNNYLKFLGRAHNKEDAIQAIHAAREVFPSYSFDLIYALPNQTLEEWMQELEEAKPFINSHISLYQLTIEKGTKFYTSYRNQQFIMPTQEEAAIFYEKTEEYLQKIGLNRYEVSNYAKAGYESQHNLNYWRYGEYLGIGPGAHSRYIKNNKRYAMFIEHNPKRWAEMVQHKGHGIKKIEIIDSLQENHERILMGLRTKEGIPHNLIMEPNKIPYLMDNDLIFINEEGNIVVKNILLLNYIISFICAA